MDEGFRPTIKAIRKWEPEVRKELRKELQGAVKSIAAGARTVASEHSKTVPPTIKTRTRIQSRKVEIEITAGSPEVPIAGLLELGNKGGGRKRKFRHPVFGDRGTWVDQDMHPYLAPVVKLREGFLARVIGKAVDNANDEVLL